MIAWSKDVIDCKMHCNKCGAKLEDVQPSSGTLPTIIFISPAPTSAAAVLCRNCGTYVGEKIKGGTFE